MKVYLFVDYITTLSNDRIVIQRGIVRNVEGNGRIPIWIAILGFCLRDWGKARSSSVMTSSLCIEIWTRHTLHRKQECQPLDPDVRWDVNRMVNRKCVKDSEGSVRGRCDDTVPAFSDRDWGTPQETSVVTYSPLESYESSSDLRTLSPFKIPSNIIFPSISMSPKWSVRFSLFHFLKKNSAVVPGLNHDGSLPYCHVYHSY
jgi:hypothetical protein